MGRMVKFLSREIRSYVIARNKRGRKQGDDFRYEATVEFFGLNRPRPVVTTQDMIDGDEAVFEKQLEIWEWDERKTAFEEYIKKPLK